MLVAPHHCSWHSLSWDSWSDYGEDAEVFPEMRATLSARRDRAMIVASSNRILDDDNDPACIRAKRDQKAIAKDVEKRIAFA